MGIIVYKPKKKLFQLIDKETLNTSDKVSAILYPDGHVDVGIDVFRLLDKADSPSFEVTTYKNMCEVEKKYIPVKIERGYYKEGDKNGRNLQSRFNSGADERNRNRRKVN